jgi:hypothetical protein
MKHEVGSCDNNDEVERRGGWNKIYAELPGYRFETPGFGDFLARCKNFRDRVWLHHHPPHPHLSSIAIIGQAITG